jgi:predicted DNA-binding ribbon-helix-helix protein
MAKKEELMKSFGDRIAKGSPTQKKAPATIADGEQMISAQEQERRSRSGRRATGDTSPRAAATEIKTSLSVDTELYDVLREIARRNGLPYKDLINACIRKYIELYEAKNGPVVLPRESRISADSLV